MQALQTIPAISVVLSVYNGGEYLKESVSSVLSQNFKDFEFLINDDYSSDGSWEYLQGLQHEKVKVYRQERNRGLFPCLNELIARSSGTLVKLWSQDDIMKPGCLETIWNFHQGYPGIGFSYSEKEIIDEFGNIIPPRYIDHTPKILSSDEHARIALYTGSIAGNIANVCLSRDALDKVGYFHEEMKISADFDMWVRIARHFDIGFIKEPIVQLRNHKKQLSRNKQYFIRRPIEDLEVFNYLLSYTKPEIKEEGIANLRKYKLVYYYTLMVKALLAGHFSTAFQFQKHLRQFAPFHQLTYSFLKWKMLKPVPPAFIPLENIPQGKIIKSIALVRFPNWGLGNLMLIWAKAFVFSQLNNIPLVVSHWWGIRLGAILRKERTNRLYLGQFKETSIVRLAKGLLKSKLARVVKEPPIKPAQPTDDSPRVYLFNELTLQTNPFQDLWEHRKALKLAIHDMLTLRMKNRVNELPSLAIGLHIRRGDFKKGSTLTPLRFFIEAIQSIRTLENAELPALVFSDGTEEELSEVLALPYTSRATTNPEIIDILALSKSKYLILSYGSTFGYWAAFLSNATVIRPKDWIERIAPDRPDEYREFSLGLDSPIDRSFLEKAIGIDKTVNK
jgi:glycosyltransferase involved in cell wall biosynthesis